MAAFTRKQLQTLKTIYLYGDGHAVCKHEKRDEDAGNVEWVEVYERFGPATYFTGRLIFSSFYEFNNYDMANIVATATKIQATKTDSEATKKAGLTVHRCEVTLKNGSFSLYGLPDLLSGDFTWQPEERWNEKWEDLEGKYTWGYNHNIAKRHPRETVSAAS